MCPTRHLPVLASLLDDDRLMALIATPHAAGLTPLPRRAASPRAHRRAVVTFAGQGVDVLDELAALVAQRPELASGVALGTEVLTRVASSELALSSGAYRHGVDVGAWVMDPDGAPPAAYLRGARGGLPARACSPTGAAVAARCTRTGARRRGRRRLESMRCFAGHSPGACLARLAWSRPRRGGRGQRRTPR